MARSRETVAPVDFSSIDMVRRWFEAAAAPSRGNDGSAVRRCAILPLLVGDTWGAR